MQTSVLVCHLSKRGVKAYGHAMRAAAKRSLGLPTEATSTLTSRLSRSVNVENVDTEGFRALVPLASELVVDATWPEALAPVIRDRDAYQAALRAHLANTSPYGPVVRRVVLVDYPDLSIVQQLIIEGRLSAVERTVPDEASRQAWRAAGVLSVEGSGIPVARQIEAL